MVLKKKSCIKYLDNFFFCIFFADNSHTHIHYVAPGAYNPDTVVDNSAPKFSFGVRTHVKIRNDNPGKNCHARVFFVVVSLLLGINVLYFIVVLFAVALMLFVELFVPQINV